MQTPTGDRILASASAVTGGGGRARRLAPRAGRIGSRLRLAVALAIAAALIAVGAVALLGGGGPSSPPHAAASARYGGLPSWLPKARSHVGRVLKASTAHPALSVEGEAVAVTLASGRVLATAVGPEVPEEGRFPVPALTPATFIVTFASSSTEIPLRAKAFTLIDEQGKVHHPKMTAVGGGAPPAQTTPGRAVSVMLHEILPTGDGGLSWTPEGARPIASWDYTVEID